MSFGAAPWLHLLWLVPLLALLLRAATVRRQRDLERLFAAGMQARHLPAGLSERRTLLGVMRVVGLGLVALGAAQPRWGFTWEEVEVRGVEVIFALDLSRSMDAQDISPSRMERARREVKDLLAGLSNDRVGMVIFAAGAYPRVPLTLDHDLLAEILDDTDTSVLQAQGSSLASALRESARLFGDEASADRAVVLLSDGESWDEDIAEAARELAEAKIEVYAIGVGTPEGAPIPEPKGGFKQSNGDVVLSRLDESALSEIAAITGGAYVRSSAGDDDTAGVLRQLRASLTRSTSATTREKRWDERFQWPLAAGLGLLLGAAALGEGRAAALVLVLLFWVSPARAAEPDPLRALTEQALDHPNDPEAQWALADGLYGAGRFDDAARVYTELAQRAPDEATRTRALYNAGVARYRAGKLDEAVSSWDEALQLDPANAAAKKNREAVSKEIAARQQLQQQRQQNQPQQGQPQEGQPQEGQPQEGQPQQGEPQQGQPQPSDGQPPPGQPEPQPGEGTRSDQPPEAPVPGQDAEGQSGTAEDSGQPQEDESTETTPATGMSATDAKRMLDAVEEGDPRVVIRGKSEAKDW